ncbi:hypothetical protein MLD38_029397 [Melastoma candidum]|uniref:Uncharacterized protein n=1 Tax=Melastoma candidum TaxID=119954 RepID=A0ACB9N5R9_9MYRT|nr:hypothetical protein MLD38_029397 [Melastoma candidum]
MPEQVLKAGSRPPWVGLAAAVWIQMSAGNSYNFPLYSSALKSVLGFNQQQLTFLGVANDLGENVGILPGIASNKFPPWAVLLVGVVSCFSGYGIIWLAVTQTVHYVPYWLLFLALCIGTHSSAWYSTAVLVTNMRNFPLSRGTVAGILKGYVGISAAVYTAVFCMVFNHSPSRLLLFLTVGIPVICLAMMYFIRPCVPETGEDSSVNCHFQFTQGVSISLAIYILVATFLYELIGFDSVVSYVVIAVMIIIMVSPLGIPVKMTFFPSDSKKAGPSDASSENTAEVESDLGDALLASSSSAANLGSFRDSEDDSDIEFLLAVGEGAIKKKRKPRRGEDFKFKEAFIKADFWLLWFVYSLGVGSGVTVLNNLAQIGIALGAPDTTILLCLFSFCNFLGRLGAGVISEYLVRWKAIPRTILMTAAQLVMIAGFLLFASGLNGTVYAGTALLGVCFGVQFSTMIPTASELFGLRHFGIIFNFLQLGNPIGAFLFSGLLAGYVYDGEAAKQGGTSCVGVVCYKLTFQVLAGVCGLGTLLSIILYVRIRPVYQMLYANGSFRLPAGLGH